MIRDQIVFGTNEKKLREKMLREADLTLENAIKIGQANELARQHALTFKEAPVEHDAGSVKAVTMKGNSRYKFKNKNSKYKDTDKAKYNCKRCGETHKPKQCPAYGKTCAKCGRPNHYAKMCLTKKKVNAVREGTDDSDDLSETFFIKMVSRDEYDNRQFPVTSDAERTVCAVKDDKWTAPLLVNGTLVTFKIDTGAKANLICVEDLKELVENLNGPWTKQHN